MHASHEDHGQALGPPLRVLASLLQSCYAALATTLEALLLVGLSSHISKLLLIYTELMRVGNLNYAVVGVTTGTPHASEISSLQVLQTIKPDVFRFLLTT